MRKSLEYFPVPIAKNTNEPRHHIRACKSNTPDIIERVATYPKKRVDTPIANLEKRPKANKPPTIISPKAKYCESIKLVEAVISPDKIKLPDTIKRAENKSRNNNIDFPNPFTLGEDEANKNLEKLFFPVLFCFNDLALSVYRRPKAVSERKLMAPRVLLTGFTDIVSAMFIVVIK